MDLFCRQKYLLLAEAASASSFAVLTEIYGVGKIIPQEATDNFYC
jgi:hypothetical protein